MSEERKKTILLVEDELIIAMDEQMTLKHYGYQVKIASTGEQAIAMVAKEGDIDLILMDINLGEGMDGTRAAELILQKHDIPLIFISAYTEQEVVERTEGITSYGYIVKNSGETVLIASIRMAFRLFEAKLKEIQKEQELREAKEQLEKYFNSSLDLLCIASTSGKFLRLNPEWEKVLGYSVTELEGQSFFDFIHPEDMERTLKVLSSLDKQEEVLSFENRYRCRDGSYRWIEWRSRPEGDLIYAAARDITDRKQMEQKLAEEKQWSESIVNYAPDIIIGLEKDSRIAVFNRFAELLTGYQAEEVYGKKWIDMFIPAEIQPEIHNVWAEIIRTRAIVHQHENEIVTRSGERRLIRWRNCLLTEDEDFRMILSIGEDITEQQRASEELQKKSKAMEAASDGIAILDSEEKYIYLNQSHASIYGYDDPSELIGKSWQMLYREPELTRFRQEIMPKFSVMGKWRGEAVGLKKDGSTFPQHISLTALAEGGLVCIVHDISERKQAEEKLREREELFRKVLATAPDLILTTDVQGTITFVNEPDLLVNLKITKEDITGRNMMSFIAEKDRALAMENTKLMFERPLGVKEYRLQTGDGVEIECEVNGDVIRDSESQPLGMVYVIRDITGRKQMEEKLRRSEENYQELYTMLRLMSDTMPDMIWAKDLKNRYIFANRAMCEKLLNARDTEEPIGKTDLFFARRERESHPDNPEWHTFGELCMDSDTVTLKNMKEMQFDEFGNVKGKFLYLDVHKAPMFNHEGKVIGVVGSARDITERKLTEETLNTERKQLLSIFESIMEPIYVCDPQTYEILYINQALRNMLQKDCIGGICYQEFQGLDEPCPFCTNKIIQKQPDNTYSWEYFNPKLGKYFSLHDRLIRWTNGRDVRLELAFDISEVKQAEGKINGLLQEKELILKETHHRIKNNITLINSMLSIQANSQNNQQVKDILSEAAGRLQSMMVLYDKLYRSENLENLSLRDFLTLLVKEIIRVIPAACPVKTALKIDNLNLSIKKMPLIGIMINELITNSIKYAYPDRAEGLISITVKLKNGKVNLNYQDNGIGLPENIDINGSSTFGLQLVNLLVKQLNGSLKISGETRNKFSITFPV